MLKKSLSTILTFAILFSLFVVTPVTSNVASAASPLDNPNAGIFGKNVFVFDESTDPDVIQNIATEVFKKQETNQFGPERYALLFKPGSYSTAVRVGFYTQVAGLGILPDEVNINGGVTVDAEWFAARNATQNFWRSIENFAVTPKNGDMLYAVSQAASMRRLHVKGNLSLHDQGGWASGGFLADSKIDGNVIPGSQQQWFSRNNSWTEWKGSLWNMTLVGNKNQPSEDWPAKGYTIVDNTPIMREKPFLTIDSSDNYSVFVPNVSKVTQGTSWQNGPDGTSIPIDQFYIADPMSFNVDVVNAALSQGKHLLLTPGVYHVSKPIKVTNPNTVVLGLGLATLHSDNGSVALQVADVDGVKIAGLLFEAGKVSSPVLLEVGQKGSKEDHSDNPTSLHDLYFRVGGDALALAEVCIQINSNHVIGDHFWVWRADHGEGAAWDSNLTTNGLIVIGNDVTIYGLFVEHFHEYQTLWNGERGKMYFYQCEIPYDVPNQESWMSNHGTVNGFAGYKVADSVNQHEAYGLGVYSFFRDVPVKLESAIEVPDKPGVKIHHAITVFLNGFGEVTHIVNSSGNTVLKGTMTARLGGQGDYIPRETASIKDVNTTTIAGKAPVLPAVVTQVFTDATTKQASVTWENIAFSQYLSEGTFNVKGTVEGSPIEAKATVKVAVAPTVAVTDITITKPGNANTITTKGGTLQLSAVVTPGDADNTSVTWSVYNTNGTTTDKATISTDGLLTAIDDGTVKVVATANDLTGVKGEAIISISGQHIKVSAITVTGAGNATAIATKGGSLQMLAAITPADAENKAVTWSVVNGTGKATIDASGVLKAQSDGTVNVVATAKDGSGVKGEATINIIGQTVTLDTGWSWVLRDTDTSFWATTNNGNVMKITTQQRNWTGTKPSLLLTVPKFDDNGDFTISTKLKFDATENYEWAGLIVYESDNNFISLGRQASGGDRSAKPSPIPATKQIRFSQGKSNPSLVQTDKNDTDPIAPGDIYLKIVKTGTMYTGFYSSNGIDWEPATDEKSTPIAHSAITYDIALSNPKVGVFARKFDTAAPVKTAEFSDFRVNGTIVPFWNPVTSVTVTGEANAKAITSEGGTLQMSAVALPAVANQTVTWSVVNTDGTPTNKASISSSGLLTAVRNGSVKVVATANDGSGVAGSVTIDLSGQVVKVSAITVAGANGKKTISDKGGTLQMIADVLPVDADNKSLLWSVFNTDGTPTDKATISAEGLLTAVNDGPVKVNATTNDGTAIKGETIVTITGQVIKVSKVTITGATDITTNGGTLQLSAEVLPANAADKSVIWSVLNLDGSATDKAYINSIGLLTAVKNGQVMVIATAKDGTALKGQATLEISGQVEVVPDPELLVTDIIVNSGSTTITNKGGTLQMIAVVLPSNAGNTSVSWSVYNVDGTETDLATISMTGLLTAVKDGTVKVVATANDDSGVTGEELITISGQDVVLPEPGLLVSDIIVTGANGSTTITSKSGTLQLAAYVLPSEASNRSVTWFVYNANGTVTDLATISTNGLLTAVKDGTVKVIAIANDGSGVAGEVTITISGQTEIGCTSNCGGYTPPVTPPVTEPAKEHQQSVTVAELGNAPNGKAVVNLGAGKTEAVIPVDAAQKVSTPVEMKSGGVSVIIPSAVFHELAGKLQGNAGDSKIIVRIVADKSGNAGFGGSNFKIDDQSYNLDIVLVDKDGKETKLSTFPEPVQVVLPYDSTSMNKDLIGIYVFDEVSKEWQYIGGKVDAGKKTITGLAPHFSTYAVLEYNKTFADVASSHWAYDTLKVLAAKHIVTGVSASEFKPNGSTTRAEFVALLVRALGLKATKANTQFADVNASDWYAQDVAAAYEAGLISGVTDTKFAPKDQITREQMAILMVRAYEYINGAKSPTLDNLADLKDQKQVSSWAKSSVNLAIELGLMKGQSFAVFAPQSNAVRVETAQAILNLIKQIEMN